MATGWRTSYASGSSSREGPPRSTSFLVERDVQHLTPVDETRSPVDPRLVRAVGHQKDERHALVERRLREPARHRRGDPAASGFLAHPDVGKLADSVVRCNAQSAAGGLAGLRAPRKDDDTAVVRRSPKPCNGAVGQRIAGLAVSLRLDLGNAAK